MASIESDEQDFTLDCLPLDCIVLICECLSAEDLGRFSRVCRVSRGEVESACSLHVFVYGRDLYLTFSLTLLVLQLFYEATLIGYLWRFVVCCVAHLTTIPSTGVVTFPGLGTRLNPTWYM